MLYLQSTLTVNWLQLLVLANSASNKSTAGKSREHHHYLCIIPCETKLYEFKKIK